MTPMVNRLAICVFVIGSIVPAGIGCKNDPQTQKRRYLERADAFVAQDKFREAVIEYRNVLQLDPQSGETRRKLASAYLRNGDTKNGTLEYVRAADLLPDDNDLQILAGSFHLLAGQFEDAKTYADKVLWRDPNHVGALVLSGNAIAGLKDMDQAIQDIQEAIQLSPAGAELYTNLGGLELKRQRVEEAEAAFRMAVTVDSKSAAAHMALGQFLWARNRAVEAEQAFTQAVALGPTDERANRALATFYLALGRIPEAEAPLKALAAVDAGVEAKVTLGDYYLRVGRTDEGIRILGELARRKEGLVPATIAVASADYLGGRKEDAHRALDQLLTTAPKDARALTMKAGLLLADGRFEDALASAKAAAEASPRSAQAQYTLGRVELALQHTVEATRAFNEVLRLNPRAVAAQIRLGEIHLKQGDLRSAIQFADRAVQSAPRQGASALARANALLAVGDLVGAEPEITRLSAAFPDNADVNIARGHFYLLRRDFARSSRAYAQAYGLSPSSLDALTGLIALDLLQRKPDAAMARMEAHLGRDASSPAFLLAAKMYGTLGDNRKAEVLLQRSIEADAGNLDAYGVLGQLYHAQGRLEEAKAKFEHLVARNPSSEMGHTLLGIVMNKLGEPDAARLQYQAALQINSRSGIAANNLACLYAAKGDKLDMALQLAQIAYSVLPNDPEIRDTLGWVYSLQQRWKDAMPLLQQNVKAFPQNSTYHYRLGVAQKGTGDLRPARKSLETALKLNPAFPEAEDAKRVLSSR